MVITDLRDRVKKRFRQVKKWADRNRISCFRFYEKDLPDHPLIIDYYAGHVLVWGRERTRDETPELRNAWLDQVRDSVIDALCVDQEKVIMKDRVKQSGKGQHEKLDSSGVIRIIQENGLNFEVNLSDYLDTGIFLDHRPLREVIRNSSSDMRFLNLFCYTGTFTVASASGGARSTCSVDLSNPYLAWAKKNLELNGLADPLKHQFLQGDCIEILESLALKKSCFDIILCDPPTFSNSKKSRKYFTVQNDHVRLLKLCSALLDENGTIYFSTNFKKFKLSQEINDFLAVKDITHSSIPEDFRNRKIHYCWKFTKALSG